MQTSTQLSRRSRARNSQLRNVLHKAGARAEPLEYRLLMAVNSWKAAVSGDWATASNWSLGHVPTATEDVSITLAGSYTVTHTTGTHQAKSLTTSVPFSFTVGTIDLAGGALTVSGGTFTFSGGVLKKPLISTSGTGVFNAAPGSPTLDNATVNANINVLAGASLYLYHNTTINAGKKINATDSYVYLYDQPDAAANLLGAGEIQLGGASGGNIYLYNSYSHVPTIGATNKIHGFGSVYFYAGTNNGTIEADVSAKILNVYGSGSVAWTSKGKLSAINGAILTLGGLWSSPSPGTISEVNSTLNLGGTFNTIPLPTRTGGTINLTGIYDLLGTTLTTTAAGGSWIITGGTIKNGSLTFAAGTQIAPSATTGTYDKITLNSDVTLPASSSLYLQHNITFGAGHKITANNSFLYLYDQPDAAANLVGTGEVILNGTSGGNLYLYNSYAHTPSIGSTIKVHGYGSVYFYAGTNNGTIESDVSGKLLTVYGSSTAWVNKGKLSAINGGILTTGGTWSSPSPGTISEVNSTLNLGGTFNTIPLPTRTGGTINLTGIYDLLGTTLTTTAAGGSWIITGGTIKNGSLTFAAGTQIAPSATTGTYDKITLNSDVTLPASSSLYLQHNITFGAGHKITANNSYLYLYDQPDAAANLVGTGEVILNGTSGGNLYLYNSYAHTPSIGSTIKVHGYGSVYFYAGTNNGTIESDVSGKLLTVYGSSTAWVNKGKLSAINGGILTTGGTWSSPSPGTISEVNSTLNLGGTFNTIPLPTRTGGTINLTGIYDLLGTTLTTTAASGSWNIVSGTLKNGGLTFAAGTRIAPNASTGTYDKITLNSDLTLAPTDSLYMQHTITLTAGHKVTVNNSYIFLYDQPDAGSVLGGTGEVIMNGTAGGNLYFYNSYGHPATIGTNVKVHGYGTVYSYGGINNGVIDADQSGKTLTAYGSALTNAGVMRASNGGVLALTQPATLTNNGALTADNGKITINGAFTNPAGGTINIGIGGTGAGSTYGLIAISGAFTMAGILNTYLINNYAPPAGTTFTPITYTSKVGAFTTTNLNAGNSIAFTPTFNATNTQIKSAAAASVASRAGGVLTFNGTAAADTMTVDDKLGVIITKIGTTTSVFQSALVTSVKISGGDQNDIITYNSIPIGLGIGSPSTINGGNGDDKITGSGFADNITGDAGNDSIVANGGSDIISLGAGNDTALGGGGDDVYIFSDATAAETDLIGESAGGGTDTIDFSAITSAVNGNLGSDTLGTMTNRTVKTQTAGQFANFENINGGTNNDTLTGNTLNNVMKGNAGNDNISGAGGNDSITGGAGNDTQAGGAGDDVYIFSDASVAETDLINEGAGAGTDTLDFSAVTSIITGKLNNDTLATMTNRTVKTQIAGTFVNLENFFGGTNNDNITGNSAKNIIKGNNGNDTINVAGDLGKIDNVDGGAGTDTVTKDADDLISNVP